MIRRRHHCCIAVILTLLCLSCNDQLPFTYPDEIVPGRGEPSRDNNVMDSTIGGIPNVVNSEWVYAHSYSLSPANRYFDTIRIRLSSIFVDSINGFRYIYQGFKDSTIDYYFLQVWGNTLYSGYEVGLDTEIGGLLWGYNLEYQFPLSVGKVWSTLFQRLSVAGKKNITVSAGIFGTYVIKSVSQQAPVEVSYRWYTPELGIIAISDTFENVINNAQLLSYHIGPRRR